MAHHKDLTGRDAYVIVEALTFTIEALSGLPIEHRPDNNIADMKRLVDGFVKHAQRLTILLQKQAKPIVVAVNALKTVEHGYPHVIYRTPRTRNLPH